MAKTPHFQCRGHGFRELRYHTLGLVAKKNIRQATNLLVDTLLAWEIPWTEEPGKLQGGRKSWYVT